ncbi:MAG: biopolymer transporter ExbD, partial [Acidobacteriales bacterium]|nr:biopolymer transporter ExbD [Terriglobales bacterium]
MNVTPMIDVLLVLIVIFLLISPTKPYGYDGQVPQEAIEKTAPTPERTVVLQLEYSATGPGVLRINQAVVEPAQLERQLADIFKTRNEKVLFFEADGRFEFAEVADLLDHVKAADRDIRIGFMTTQAAKAAD